MDSNNIVHLGWPTVDEEELRNSGITDHEVRIHHDFYERLTAMRDVLLSINEIATDEQMPSQLALAMIQTRICNLQVRFDRIDGKEVPRGLGD